MNAPRRPAVTEREIQAYVDGQLAPGTVYAEAVEAHLAAHPGARDRVRAYRRQDEAIRTRYQDILAQPVPERLRPAALRAARREPGARRLPGSLRYAAGLAGLCGAALIGWLAGQPPAGPLERFAERTAAYLAAPDRAPPAGSPATLQSLSALGGAPDFDSEGLQLVSARRVDNGEMYEARYEDTTGRELRLFVAPDPQRHNDLLYRTRADGRQVVYWQQGPLMYALTGDFSRRDLDGFANTAIKRFRDRLDAGRFARADHDATSSSTRIEPIPTHRDNSDESQSVKFHTSQSRLEDDVGSASGNGNTVSVPAVNQELQTDYRATQ